MLETRDLTYTYPGGDRLVFPDLNCPAGETRLLIGKSGSGKTTLLRLLAGLLRPATGRVVVAGQDLAALSGPAADRFRGRHVGLVYQTPHFLRAVDLRTNLRLAQQLAGHRPDDARIDDLLGRLGLDGKAGAYPQNLSVGQQQRAAIARAIVNQPAVVLADEPTSALDDDNARAVVDLLREQTTAVNATLLIVTHDTRLTSLIPQQTRLA